MIRRLLRSTLFPYTTLFRSLREATGPRHPPRPPPATGRSGHPGWALRFAQLQEAVAEGDRKSTRLNSSHTVISYAVFCLKKKKKYQINAAEVNTFRHFILED